MSKKPDIQSFKESLSSVPRSFVAYKKDSISTVDQVKKERRILAPAVFAVIFYLSCVFLIGAHYRGVDYFITHTDSFLYDLGLLKSVAVFSVGSSLLLGLILFAVLFIVYVLTRFVCVKLFTSGTPGKTVLLESIIEFGMNTNPLIIFFLLGGVLSDLVWWSFYPLMIFFTLFFIIMLLRSIFDAVDRTKQRSLMVFVTTFFVFIGSLLITAVTLLIMAYSVLTITQGVYDNVVSIIDGIKNWFNSVFGGIFK